MQPFAWFLTLEAGIFLLSVFGDVYLTNALVKRHGTMIESNERVKRMYEQGKLWKSWLGISFCLSLFIALYAFGLLAVPYAPFLSATSGLLIAGFPVSNMVRGSLVLLALRKT